MQPPSGFPLFLGYGIDGGRYLLGYDQPRVIDLRDAAGNLIPANANPQMAVIPDLPMDLSQIVDPQTCQQLMTVGSHWPASGPLSEDQRTRMERTGVCMGCHQNMADTAFWTDQVIAQYGRIVSNDEHINTMNQLVHDAVAGEAVMLPPPGESEEVQQQVAALEKQLGTAQAELSGVQSELDRTRGSWTKRWPPLRRLTRRRQR